MKNPARPPPSRARRLTDRRWQLCPRPTHRKPPVHPYQKRTAKLRRFRWTQATAIGIPLRSPLQPHSISKAVARKGDQRGPRGRRRSAAPGLALAESLNEVYEARIKPTKLA